MAWPRLILGASVPRFRLGRDVSLLQIQPRPRHEASAEDPGWLQGWVECGGLSVGGGRCGRHREEGNA
jgi:hypothetical protein